MWFDSDDDQDADRYPFFPADTGSPIVAAITVICVVGALAAIFLARPWP